MEQTHRLSRLMQLSWEVQRTKQITRSKALSSAWAIMQNEEITIHYLVNRFSHERNKNKVKPQTLTLFKQQ